MCGERGKPCSITHQRLPFSKPSTAVLICVVWDTVHVPRQWTNLLPPIILVLGEKKKKSFLVSLNTFILNEVWCL